jgi:rod shape-determining protein MreD
MENGKWRRVFTAASFHFPFSIPDMRWFSWFILAYLAVGLQLGLEDFVSVRGGRPNFVLLAVIFIAANAPREPALLGCLGIGAMLDMTTLQPLGLYALSCALVAMLVVRMQEYIPSEHPLGHILLALLGGLVASAVVILHGRLRGPHVPAAELLAGTVYTAALAPLALGGLQRIKRAFAFSRRRRLAAF